MTKLMIDIECLGLEPGCRILSVAAVPFCNEFPVEYFYEKLDSSLQVLLSVNAETIEWWAQQDPSVRDEAFSGTMHIDEFLDRFAEYIKQFPISTEIYSKPGSFDIKILEYAYKVYGKTIPWHYRQPACHRTLENIGKIFGITPAKPLQAHNALEDARAQAFTAENIFNQLEKLNASRNSNVSGGDVHSPAGNSAAS